MKERATEEKSFAIEIMKEMKYDGLAIVREYCTWPFDS